MRKIVSLVFALYFFVVGLVGLVLALPTVANLKFYTSETNPKTGEYVEFELKVDGNKKTPFYTYVVVLDYDSTKLKFENTTVGEGWMQVDAESVNDLDKGIIKRTLGYPGGADKLLTAVKYKFKVLAPGKAQVKITGEAALDSQNKSVPLQKKNITIVISGQPLKEELEAIKTQGITLNIAAADTILPNENYQVKITHNLQNKKLTIGTTSMAVYNESGEKAWSEEKTFSVSDNFELDFMVPANTLTSGSYNLVVESNFSGQKESNKQTKTLKVVSDEKVPVPVVESDNVFVNIWNAVWRFIVTHWLTIFGIIFILWLLRFLAKKLRWYRRRDGR